ncbi:DUF2505 domain-containing protein [Endozoicomonadaceae bacterium StTr2]
MAKITAEHHYSSSVDDIFNFFSDEETISAKYDALGSRKFRLKSKSERGNTTKIDLLREAPASDAIPKALQKLLGEWNKVRQRETWTQESDGSRLCKLQVELDGVPVKIKGEMRLCPTEEGCVNKVRIEASSIIPIIGKAVTGFVSDEITKQMEEEYAYIKSA